MILQIPLASPLLLHITNCFNHFFFFVYIATPFMTSGMSSSLFSLLKLLYILTYLPFTSALTSSIENE